MNNAWNVQFLDLGHLWPEEFVSCLVHTLNPLIMDTSIAGTPVLQEMNPLHGKKATVKGSVHDRFDDLSFFYQSVVHICLWQS